MDAPDPALIERFRSDLEALTGEAPSPARRLGLAVSGGPDSMAMLLLAAATWPGAVETATVNHGFRTEAAAEAEMVAALCARIGVPHAILHSLPGRTYAGSVQERARALRYDALAEWAASRMPWVATAHQRDDVAESFLMRARRGAGVGGLAAMRATQPLGDGITLLRPLLGWSREDLAGVLCRAGVEAADDPSNRDPRHDRSRTRALIAASAELVASRLALSAQNLRHAEEAIGWTLERELHRLDAQEDGSIALDCDALPYELRRRLVRRAVQQVRDAAGKSAPWHEQGLDRLIATLEAGGTGTIADVQARPIRGKWHFRLAPPRRSH